MHIVSTNTPEFTATYRQFFFHSMEGLFVIDPLGKILFCNPAANSILGFTEQELINTYLPDRVPDEWKEECEDLRKKWFSDHLPSQLNKPIIKLISRNGNKVFIELNVIRPTQVRGQKSMLILFSNVTRRFLTNANLKHVNELYEHVLEQMGEAFVSLDKHWRYTYINTTALGLLHNNRFKQDYLGQVFWEVFPETLGTDTEQYYREVMELKRAKTFRAKSPLFHTWVEERVCSFDGGIAIFSRDITAEKKKEDAMKRFDLGFEKAFHFSRVALALLDLKNGNFIEVNESFLRLFELDVKAIMNSSWSKFLHAEADDPLSWEKISCLLKEKETIQDMGLTRPRSSGRELHALVSFEILALHEESCILVSILDQTETIKAQRTILAMNEALEHKVFEKTFELSKALEKEKNNNALKSKFVSMASHEFKTPLTSLLTSVSILEQYTEAHKNEKLAKHFLRIKMSVNTLNEVLNDFLSIDKIESGKAERTSCSFDLKEMTEGIIDEVEGILKKGQFIRYVFSGDPLLVQERTSIHNSLINLLSNASKYSAEGKRIDFFVEVDDTGVTATIRDYGIGIPGSEQDKVFSTFFRATNAETIQGTGLGLNIVKKYMHLIGGSVSFASKLNEGSTFTLRFPKIRKPE